MGRLPARQVQALDPYAFLAVLGNRVIHPGGRVATDRLLGWARIGAGHRVLDIGCGVGTTAVRIARETGADVTAADISDLMLDPARRLERAGHTDIAVLTAGAEKWAKATGRSLEAAP